MKKLVAFVVMFAAALSLSAVAFAGGDKACCKQNFGPKNSSKQCCGGKHDPATCPMSKKACCDMKGGQHSAHCAPNAVSEAAKGAGETAVAVPTAAVEVSKEAVTETAKATGSAVANVVDAVTPN